jgi:hypothetical protein
MRYDAVVIVSIGFQNPAQMRLTTSVFEFSVHRGAYDLQFGDRFNDLNILPKASCRHRNTLLVVFP